MKLKKINFSGRFLIIALVTAIMIPVAVFPDRYVPSVSYGLNLFVLNVFPALFPFFFFSTVLSNLNFGYDLGMVVKKPLKKLFNAPPLAGYVFVMSLLCGYPVGAKILADFYDKGLVSSAEAKGVAAFTSTSGPLFIVGTVGVAMLNDKTAGFLILAGHYAASFLNGFLFRRKKSDSSTEPLAPIIKSDAVLKNSITSALVSVAIVGGYIAVFNLLVDMFFDAGIIPLFAAPIKFFGVKSDMAEGIISAFIEITRGCLMVSQSGYPIQITAPVCAFLISNGGLSITMQSLTFLGKCKISPAYYLLFKTTQGILAFLICFGLCALMP